MHKPAILLLDEVTSAPDAVSEARIHCALTELSCTRIVIAYHLSTVRLANLVVAMDQGTVVEAGTHEELLTAGGALLGRRLGAGKRPQG